jgi:hypothetical protein
LCGRRSAAYLADTLSPDRMAKVIPQERLIALLRTPVDRANSQYHHWVGSGQETLKFEGAIEAEAAGLHSGRDEIAPYLARGVYVDQLLRWSRFFNREQMLVLRARTSSSARSRPSRSPSTSSACPTGSSKPGRSYPRNATRAATRRVWTRPPGVVLRSTSSHTTGGSTTSSARTLGW